MISTEQIRHFKDKGWVAVPIFSKLEIDEIKNDYHNWLRTHGVDPDNLTKSMYHNLPTGNTCHLNCFYSPFKLKSFSLDERVWSVMSKLWAETFASGDEPGFEGLPFDPTCGFVSIDRASFRFPKSVIGNKVGSNGLLLHIDRNPYNPPTDKWRPIQMSLALVDHDGSGTDGGIGFVPGFHLEFDDYFEKHQVQSDKQFLILKKRDHPELWNRIEWANHPAGSIMLWDNRLPHLTCPVNDRPNGEARQAFFSSFLPAVHPNTTFIRHQTQAFLNNQLPPHYLTEKHKKKNIIPKVDGKPVGSYNFTPLQRKLLGLDRWSDGGSDRGSD